CGQQAAGGVLDDDRRRAPTGTWPDAARVFEHGEECVADEGIGAARQPVPFRSRQAADRWSHAGRQIAFCHGALARGWPGGLRAPQGVRATIASTSTAAPKGRTGTPTALRACLPASPNTCAISSDAPLATLG